MRSIRFGGDDWSEEKCLHLVGEVQEVPKYPASRMPIPVRYEMRGYNTLLGSHYDHYYLEYDSYNHADIPNEVFEIDPCE